MRVCVLIPVYNHGDALVGTLERLAPYELPTILVDDGSDEHTRSILGRLAEDYDLTLVTLPGNQGKGAAVQAGFRKAAELGFSHALQVDSDGQHDLDDIGLLLDAANDHPDALISGNPHFDASAPASRRYGRSITTFWVAVETLSLDIKDAMCGFRVYPLAPCLELMDKRPLGPRMEFDIEIAVRLYWLGAPFVAVPTNVIYPEDGMSHFRVLADNWRISRTHTRLLFGMLLRLPMLLARKLGMRRHHWSGLEERGAVLGMKILFNGYRVLGRWGFRIMLFPVITYFYLTSATARRASRQYLDRVQRTRSALIGRPAKRLSGIRHFLQFGESILDKLSQWAGVRSRENIRYVDPEKYDHISSQARGGVFIGSHLGNLEALRAFGGLEQSLTVNALVFTRHSQRFMQFLEQANPKAVENLIQVDTLGPDSIIRLAEMIEAGEWVATVADRTSITHEVRSIAVEFLGDKALFPEGPFILASLLECPVYLLFCIKQDGKYVVYLDRIADKLDLPRSNRSEAIREYVEIYVRKLEERCLATPYQWYNFFDFWQMPANKNS